ncbi:MAG: fibronectin type III domain-containing protein, partial [Planctomycetota bacterium]|nr:fibronectin type III domain-containing protein [Planctomycetota bacterium]
MIRQVACVKGLLALGAFAGLCAALQGIAVASRPTAINTQAKIAAEHEQPTDPATPTPPAQPERQRGRKGGGGGKDQQPRGDNLMSRMTGFLTDVPAQDHSMVLVQAQPTSMGISAVVASDRLGQVVYMRADAAAMHKTEIKPLKAGSGELFTLSGLSPGTTYTYRFVWTIDGKQQRGEPRTFTTPGGNVDSVRFTVIADSHLDTNMDPKVYAVA